MDLDTFSTLSLAVMAVSLTIDSELGDLVANDLGRLGEVLCRMREIGRHLVKVHRHLFALNADRIDLCQSADRRAPLAR